MRGLEQRLNELEGRHNGLTQSYECLQAEHAIAKQELESLRQENERFLSGKLRIHKAWNDSKLEILDPLLFDVSAFCFDQEEIAVREDRQEGTDNGA